MRYVFIVLFSMGFMTIHAEEIISSRDSKNLERYMQQELEKASSDKSDLPKEEFATRYSLVKNEKGEPILTDYVIIIYHGLFESPYHNRELHQHIFETYKQNTISVRLAGHFDAKIPMDKAKYQDWIDQVQAEQQVFFNLGKKAIFIGHSTGGLLASMMALNKIEKTQALIGAAAAFKLTSETQWMIWAGSKIGFNMWDPIFLKRRVPSLGNEVVAMGEHVRNLIKKVNIVEKKGPDMIFLDTKIDGVVVPGSGHDFFKQFDWVRSNTQTILPARSGVLHKDVLRSDVFKNVLKDYFTKIGILKN